MTVFDMIEEHYITIINGVVVLSISVLFGYVYNFYIKNFTYPKTLIAGKHES